MVSQFPPLQTLLNEFHFIFGIMVATGRLVLLSNDEGIVLSETFSRNFSQHDKKTEEEDILQQCGSKKQSSNILSFTSVQN